MKIEKVMEEIGIVKREDTSNFMSQAAVKSYGQQSRMLSTFMDKNCKRKIWKPSRMNLGRYSEIGRILNGC